MDRNILYNDSNIIIVNHIEDFKGQNKQLKTDQLIFLGVQKGTVHLNVDGVNYDLASDDVLLCFPRQVVHEYHASEDFHGSVMLIKANLVKTLVHSSLSSLKDFFYAHSHPVLHLNVQTKRLFAKYVSLLVYRYEHPAENYNTDIVNAILQAMLFEMLNQIGRDEKSEETHILRQGERLFKSFLTMLIEDQVCSRSVSEYAARLCVTSKYLSAVCKQLTGRTALSWINEYVMKDVLHLLKNSDLSIKEIAAQLNFPNVSFFGKYVKNQLGMSPSEFRKKGV